jgi:hypothetical protein
MKRWFPYLCFTLFAAAFAWGWQGPTQPGAFGGQKPGESPDVKLPDGKSQRDAIVKDEFKRNLKDVEKLATLANELKEAMEASDAHIVSLKIIKQTEEIEKLAKTIRGRLKRF